MYRPRGRRCPAAPTGMSSRSARTYADFAPAGAAGKLSSRARRFRGEVSMWPLRRTAVGESPL